MNLKVKSKKRNKINSVMLARLHHLENHSSLFMFQLWRFHRHCGKWFGFHLTKNYSGVYIYGSILMRSHIYIFILLKAKGNNVSIPITLVSNPCSVRAYTIYTLSVSFFREAYTHFIISSSGPSQWYCTCTCLSRKTEQLLFFPNEK